jgi:hypothetical protein
MSTEQQMQGKVAFCSRGIPGIITSNSQEPSEFDDNVEYWPEQMK